VSHVRLCVCSSVYISSSVFVDNDAAADTYEYDSDADAAVQRNRLAWPHRRRGLASDGGRYADAQSSVGRRFRSATKLRLEWYGEVFLLLLLQQRAKHPREMRITPKASTSLFDGDERCAHWAIVTPSPRSLAQALPRIILRVCSYRLCI